MRIKHTVIFTFYQTTTEEQIIEVIKRLNKMGDYLTQELGVTEWVVAKHIPETFKKGRAHLLQECIFPNLDALKKHSDTITHTQVVALTSTVSDWMTVDTFIK